MEEGKFWISRAIAYAIWRKYKTAVSWSWVCEVCGEEELITYIRKCLGRIAGTLVYRKYLRRKVHHIVGILKEIWRKTEMWKH